MPPERLLVSDMSHWTSPEPAEVVRSHGWLGFPKEELDSVDGDGDFWIDLSCRLHFLAFGRCP